VIEFADDDEPPSQRIEEDEPRPRRKKRRKAIRREKLPGFFDDILVYNFGKILGCLAAVAVLTTVVAIAWPEFALIPICIGVLVVIFSSIWFLFVAFNEHVAWGIFVVLCSIFFPIGVLVFVYVKQEVAWRPMILSFLGWFLIIVGFFQFGRAHRSLEPVIPPVQNRPFRPPRGR
jgi:hypothetical protein